MSQRHHTVVVLGSFESRFAVYRRLTNQSKGATAVLFETITEAERFAQLTGAILYTSHQNRRDRLNIWSDCLTSKSLKIVGTRQAVFLPNLNYLAIDDPERYGFRNNQIPRYFCLDIARWRSTHQGVKLLIGSPGLSCDLALVIRNGAKLLGRGSSTPVQPVPLSKLVPSRADLVVLPAAALYGSFPRSNEVTIGQLEYLEGHWPRAWLTGFEELLAIPNYNQQEKLYLKLQRLRYLADEVLVSTSLSRHPIFKPNFIDIELAERKQLGLPPFGRLVKVAMPNGEVIVRKLPLSASVKREVASFGLPKATRITVDPDTIF